MSVASQPQVPLSHAKQIDAVVETSKAVRLGKEQRWGTPHLCSPFIILWRYRDLIVQMVQREVVSRYRGSVLGMAWSFLTPLFLLAIYTFVFGFVLRVRWGTGAHSQAESVLMLFTGLIVYWLFSECVNRAPGLVVTNVNYVKKVIFPLEILPWVAVGSALFNAAMNLLVLLLFAVVLRASLPWTVLLLPLIFLPLVMFTLGLSWGLASLGVFLRDIGQTITLMTTALLFISPVLYPVSAVPASVQPFLYVNPLTFIVEQTREVLLWGRLPHWQDFGLYLLGSLVVAWLGLLWFHKTRRGFADVL